MKRIIRACMVTVLLLVIIPAASIAGENEGLAGRAVSAASALDEVLRGLSGAFEQAEKPRKGEGSLYTLGENTLASIPAVVGERVCILEDQGEATPHYQQQYAYRSDTVRDDLLAYIDYLGEQGFSVVRGAPLGEPGEGELSAPAKETGYTLRVRLSWSKESYHIRLSLEGARLVQQPVPNPTTEEDASVVAEGRTLIDVEAFEEALALFDAALAKAPDIAAYHGGRGAALVGIGRYEEALSELDAAIQMDPAYWEYHNDRGVALYFLDRKEEALTEFQEAIDLDPTLDDAHYNLAYLMAQTGSVTDAVQEQIKALEGALHVCLRGTAAFPESAYLWALMGDIQADLGACRDSIGDTSPAKMNYAMALNAYDKAIALGDYTAGDFSAYAEVKRKAESGAQRQTEPAGAMAADEALLERGRGLIDKGEHGEALKIFDAAVKDHPDVKEFHFGRGVALAEAGQTSEAIAALTAAIHLDPTEWAYYSYRGLANYAEGRTREALDDLKRAAELSPDADDAHFYLAFVQKDMGALQDATRTCLAGIALFPESGDLWSLLGDVYWARGEASEALSAYDNAIRYGAPAEDLVHYDEAKEKTGPVTTRQPTPPVGASGLKNYEDWLRPYVEVMPFQPSILDGFMHSRDYGIGVNEAVAYPRAWPSQWLAGVIPTYTGQGWMYDLYVRHPNMSYAAEDIQFVAVTVYDYDPGELDAYIAGLPAHGFEPMAESPYGKASWMDSLVSFQGEGCILTFVYGHGEGAPVKMLTANEDPEAPQPFVQFNVDFTGASFKLDDRQTVGTELLNYEEWCDLSNIPAGERDDMDQLLRSKTDEHGRLYETIYFPSRWPKDIFGKLIPEYTLPGVMYYMEVTTPADHPSRDATLIASLYVAGFSPEYVEQYAREIASFGYREVPREEYTEQDATVAAEMDSYHIFTLPSMRCFLGTFVEDGTELLQICLRFDGRYANFFEK